MTANLDKQKAEIEASIKAANESKVLDDGSGQAAPVAPVAQPQVQAAPTTAPAQQTEIPSEAPPVEVPIPAEEPATPIDDVKVSDVEANKKSEFVDLAVPETPEVQPQAAPQPQVPSALQQPKQ